MAITFYSLSGSPFSWKVWLALECKELPYEHRVLSADDGDLKAPAFLAINPRGKVPVIVDDGFVLRESTAIVEYLEDRYPQSGHPLWPRDLRSRALARRIALEGDALIYPGVRRLVVELIMRKHGTPDEAAIGEAKSALGRELATLDGAIARPFVMGPEPSAADFALYPFLAVLHRVAARRPEHAIGEVVPESLKSWTREIEALPYFARTIPPHWKTT